MSLFESILLLLLTAVILTALARRLDVPYPALLALSGAGLAFIPFVHPIEIEPGLALVLFVAPVLVDAAFDTSPRDLWRNRLPLTSLVVVAVTVTTAAVAYVGWRYGHLPLAAAVALGAIVAPPDASAASAVLRQLNPPRRALIVLQGESLLNDAVALLIYRIAVVVALGQTSWSSTAPTIVLAAAVSPVVGYLLAQAYKRATAHVNDAPSGTVLQFISTFGVWLIADRLGLSAIITMVVYAMTLAHSTWARSSPRNRISSLSVWETAIFVLNVLAFVLMGLQARSIVQRLAPADLGHAAFVALAVLATVIATRLCYVMFYVNAVRLKNYLLGVHLPTNERIPPTIKGGLLISWCGMRGLVTLAAAFALPQNFPGHDVILLSAFCVTLGTLVIQGFTIGPLLKWLHFAPDTSDGEDMSHARVAMIDAALDALADDPSREAKIVRAHYLAAREIAADPTSPRRATADDELRLRVIAAQRLRLYHLRVKGEVGDATYFALQEEIDWTEMDALPADRYQSLSTS